MCGHVSRFRIFWNQTKNLMDGFIVIRCRSEINVRGKGVFATEIVTTPMAQKMPENVMVHRLYLGFPVFMLALMSHDV